MRAPGDCNPRPRNHYLQLRSHVPVDGEMPPFRLGGKERENLASRPTHQDPRSPGYYATAGFLASDIEYSISASNASAAVR